jgi:tetratricopeptide (TPR) repeat protein
MRSVLCQVCLLLAVCDLSAQDGSRALTVRGEVQGEQRTLPPLMLELRDLDHPGAAQRVLIGVNGDFELQLVQPGHYQAIIMNMRGHVVHQELVEFRGPTGFLTLHLPAQSGALPAGGKISAARLLHPTSRKAEKELLRAEEAVKAGEPGKALEHLRKAIQIDPCYMEAHNNLGVRYMALNQYERAAEEFATAAALDPGSAIGHLNLSLALIALRRNAEAEAPARRALQLAAHSAAARYALGQALFNQRKQLPEALENLRAAAAQFPKARLLAAGILFEQGAERDAGAELRAYLQSGAQEQREYVEALLKRLEANQAAAPGQ